MADEHGNGNGSAAVAVQAGRMDRSTTLGQLAKAKAQAQAKFTPLGKDKTADIATRTGGKYSYAYADLATCLEAVIPALSEAGIALFQPVRIDGVLAVATTLLVHESGEWLGGDFSVAVVDPQDARSVGSAATYARRYGLLSMLGYASSDEDDDGQEARGGDHEMAKGKSEPACPSCGVAGSIIKGAPQYGGGWVCWAKRGGCGTKWPDGPFPTSAPLDTEYQPRSTAAKSPGAVATVGLDPAGAPGSSGSPASGVHSPASPDLTKPLAASIDQAREKKAAKGKTEQRVDSILQGGKAREADSGAPDDTTGAQPPAKRQAGQHSGGAEAPAAAGGPAALKGNPANEPPQAGDEPAPETDPDAGDASQDYACVECREPLGDEPVLQRGGDWLHARCVTRVERETPNDHAVETEFVLHGNRYITKGMTAVQMDASFKLTTQLDKAKGKGTSKEMLGKMLGLPADDAKVSRLNLTEANAAEFLRRMEAALSNAPAEQTALA